MATNATFVGIAREKACTGDRRTQTPTTKKCQVSLTETRSAIVGMTIRNALDKQTCNVSFDLLILFL